MAARSIASLSLTFGLVSIPVKLYSATDSAAAIRFKLMSAGGSRVRQQYVADAPPSPAHAPALEDAEDEAEAQREAETEAQRERDDPAPEPDVLRAKGRTAASRVIDFPSSRQEPAHAPPAIEPATSRPSVLERAEMVKGYEYEKGRFVLFTAAELKALEAGSRQTIDIVSFVPAVTVDPLYYDKPYFLAPDKGGAKPYSLLLRAMRETGRCALAKWAFRAKEYLVQIRPAEGGMVLQQLLYAEEVRSIADLGIDLVDVGAAELELARKLIEQISEDRFDPGRHVDEEKARILAAVERKVAGREIVAPGEAHPPSAAKVFDLVEALRASLQRTTPAAAGPSTAKGTEGNKAGGATLGERKPARRAPVKAAKSAAPTRSAARKARSSE